MKRFFIENGYLIGCFLLLFSMSIAPVMADAKVGEKFPNTVIACSEITDVQTIVMIKIVRGDSHFYKLGKKWIDDGKCFAMSDSKVVSIDDNIFFSTSEYHLYAVKIDNGKMQAWTVYTKNIKSDKGVYEKKIEA